MAKSQKAPGPGLLQDGFNLLASHLQVTDVAKWQMPSIITWGGRSREALPCASLFIYLTKGIRRPEKLIFYVFFFLRPRIQFEPRSPEIEIQILSKYPTPGGIYNIHLPGGSSFWLL